MSGSATLVARVAGSSSSDKFVDIHVSDWAWVVLLVVVGALLMFDLFVLHRHPKVLHARRAAIEVTCWVAVGLGFGVAIALAYGGSAAGEYFSGYVIEYSLSVDNVFVWALILSYFAVPIAYQHRVLFWGIFGALVMRAGFIFAGVALLDRFEWVLYVFGAFLVYTALRLVFEEESEMDPAASPTLRLLRRVVPTSEELDGQKLFTRVNGRRLATPLFTILLLIEATDVLFAVDSVPAVLAVSREQFIVFSSNVFAILGLRALYFLLADAHARFTYLKQGLSLILGFVGLKMLISHWYHVPTAASLAFIAAVLAASIGLSVRSNARAERAALIEPD